MSTKLPVLSLSHGSPMFAVEIGQTGPILQGLGQQLQDGAQSLTLRGVVIMSPHWMTRGPAVMTNPAPPTWHDFGGFPPALYQLQYPAPGAPALAQEVLDALQAAGVPAQADAKRPLDHGAWVPLMHLFPRADVPVVQVALPVEAGPREVYALGFALRQLREQGVFIVGSGGMTHNLGEFFGGRPELSDPADPYVIAFSRWVEEAVQTHDRERLFNYRTLAPHAVRAHPSEEHFLPIFFALGAAGWGESASASASINYLSREVMYRYLAMDAFVLQ
jgi:4,5-DOPA dioxygenase extradiol